MKINQIPTDRAIQIILKRFHKLESIWQNADLRKQELLDLKQYLSDLDERPDNDIHYLTRLHNHIDDDISLDQLWTFMVPVEREFSKTNTTDNDFLVTTEDGHINQKSCMPVSVIVDNLRSSFNVGGIFRSADCAGLSKIYLGGYSATPDQIKVQKSSMGAHSSVEWETKQNILELIREMKKNSIQIIALETVPTASTPAEADIHFPCALMLGNERFGLSQELLAEADMIIRIPVYGDKNSLNVVSAFSICAYEIRKKWESKGQMSDGRSQGSEDRIQ